MTLLRWRSVTRDDREALRAFTCTVPDEKIFHAGRWEKRYPRPYERRVQANIRTGPLGCAPHEFFMLGWDDAGIGAAIYWEQLDGPGLVELRTCAVDNRHRRAGGGVADEMISLFISSCFEAALQEDVESVIAIASIHEDNRNSQDLFRRHQFAQTALADGDGLQAWSTEILVAGAEFND